MRETAKSPAIYEKAFPSSMPLKEKLSTTSQLGFSGIEISIDSDPERMRRLEWSPGELSELKAFLDQTDSNIQSITLSIHRDIPLGSQEPDVRKRAREIGSASIRIAEALQIPIIQVAGYFATDSDRAPQSRSLFVESLKALSAQAIRSGVMLALENVDGKDVLSAQDGISIVQEVDSPSLRLYLDVGNYLANGLDAIVELQNAMPYACAIQLKDTRIGVFRRVPFGEGDVPFRTIFEECIVDLTNLPISLEIWNDGESLAPAKEALAWFKDLWSDVNSYRWDQLQSDDHGHSH